MSKKLILVLVLALFGSTAFLRAATTDPNAELTTLTYVAPADQAQNVSGNVVLNWIADENATEYQLYFGTTYPPQLLVDWTPITSTNCTYDVSDLIENNNHYFWTVVIRNDASTLTGETWGFTSVLSAPYNVEATVEQLYPGDSTMIKWKSPVTTGGGGVNGELTFYDGTATNSYVPVYGFYADAYLKCQFVMSSEVIEEMSGSVINAMKFYLSSPAETSWGAANFHVYITEVDDPTISAFIDPTTATTVYQGPLDGTQPEMLVEFTEPYTYTGGNLLIGFDNTATGTYKSCTFTGTDVTGACVQGYSYSSLAAIEPTQRNFVPKTTFVCGNAKDDRALRGFNLFVDGEQVNDDYITENRYWLYDLGYNTDPGHQITVTCVYDEGESQPSEPATVQMTGYGTITGTVTDVMTGDVLIGATVAFYGKDEYENSVNYTTTTDSTGVYTMEVLAGAYGRGKASYPTYGDAFSGATTVNYDATTTVNFALHEAFNPVYKVYAQDMGDMAKITWSFSDFDVPSGGGGGGGGGGGATFTEGFESGLPTDWTVLDANSDGYSWTATSAIPNTWTYYAGMTLDWYHNGTNAMCSGSYINGVGALSPDEYLITPQVTPANGSTFSFWAAATDASYAADHFGVAVSTSGTSASDFTMIQEWTLTAKEGGMNGGRASRDGNGGKLGTWYNYTVDLSAYAGQNIYIAIRHFNCYDQYIMCVDDVELGSSKDRSVEYYTLYRKAILKETITEEDSIVLASQMTDTLYADFSWFNAEPGLYQYGVSAVYPALPQQGKAGSREELTVYDGTSTNNHVPMYVFYFDDFARSQYVIPAEALADMADGDITSIKYYTTTSNIPYTTVATVDFYMTEVPYTTITSFIDKSSAQVVYTGTVSFALNGGVGEGVITLNTPYHYNGGNLLIGCDNINDAGYKNIYFYGQTVAGASVSGSNSSSTAAVTPTNQDFIPKTTFTFEPGAAAGDDDPVTEITWSNILPKDMETTVTVSALTNVGDYAGTTVKLENVAENYTYNAVLDTTNSVTFTDFRRGDYKLTVKLDGFSTNYDNTPVSIWEESEFSAYLEELLIPVNEVLVSGTGFARWSDLLPQTDVAQLYHVVCNGVFQGEITESYMQLDVANLTVGETYPVDVAVRYSTGLSPFTTGYFTYIGCDGVAQTVEDLTGAANCMDVVLAWNGGSNPPTPPTPPTPGETYSFEGSFDGWTTIDADGDGYNWQLASILMAGYLLPSHDGEDCVSSQSYDSSAGALTPDNYLVSPAKGQYPSISFWACAQDPSYAAEHFGVAVSTGSNTNAADFTTIQEWTMTAKNDGKAGNYMSRSREGKEGTWYQYTVDLSNYAGQDIWVAIRHFNCSDWFYLNVDEVSLGGGSGPNPPTPPTPGDAYTFEDGTMQGWTSLDADADGFGWDMISMFSGTGHNNSSDGVFSQSYDNTYGVLYPDNYLICPAKGEYSEISFYACAQDNLYAAEHFGVAVSTGAATAADFTTVQEWTMTAKSVGAPTTATRSGNRTQGAWYQYTVDLSAYAGQEIWVAIRHFNCSDMFYLDVDDISLGDGGTPTPPTPPTPGDAYTFEDGTMQGWTSLDADADGFGWDMISMFSGTGHNNSSDGVFSQSYDNTYGVLYPDNYLICPAKGEYSEISFYACAQDNLYAAEHFGVAVSTGAATAADFTTVQEWTMTAKSVGAPTTATRSGNRTQGAWYQYTVDLSAYAGQEIWVAIRHFNCSDMFYLDVDDISLVTPEKRGPQGVEACGTMIVTDAASEMWDLQGTITCSSAGQQAVATDGTYVYTASWQSAPTGGNTFYKYTMDGTFVEGFNIPGASEIRDLTFDGTYFYGTSGASVLYIIDLANKTLVGTINCAGATTRHCSYDPDQDGFWTGNWSDLYFYDRNGVKQFTAPAPSSAYGSAYYKDQDGNAHLYLFCQPNSDAKVYDYNITTNTLGTSPVCDFASTPGYNQGISGGAFIGNYNNLTCFFGNMQQDPNLIGIYELGAAGSGGGGAIGANTYTPNKFNILVDGVVVAATSENTYTWTAEDTAEHTYQVVYVDANYNISCPAEVVVAAGSAEAPYDLAGAYVWDDGTFGAQIEWSYGEPAETDFHYDNDTPAISIGEGSAGIPFWWGIMIPAADLTNYAGATLTKVAFYEYSEAGTYTVFIHQGGSSAPGELVYSQDVQSAGSQDWNEFELDTPVEIDPTQNLWIIMYNEDMAYPAVCCANTGDANGRWVSEDGVEWFDIAAAGLSYTWMVRGIVNNPNGGGNLIDPTEFNVYRNNQVITTVPYDGSVNYTYFDNVAAGNYTYKVSAVYSNTCESDYALTPDESQNYVEVNVTSVTDLNDEVALYPNPTNGMVTIEAAGMNHIAVVNALGQVVYSADVNTDMTQLNLGQFNAGIYMVRISTENGVGVKRVTVVK